MRIITRKQLCLISLTLAGLCLATTGQAAQSSKTTAAKQNGQTYQVKSGDSLDRIAKKAGTSVAELQRLNQLPSSALKPGQKLRLPVAATKASGKKTAAKPTATKPAAAKPTSMATATHQVKKGESLYQIARRHKVSVEDLQRWNKLTGTALKPGQSLLIAEKTRTGPAVASTAVKPEPATANQIHIVVKGESLYQIARSNGVSVEELLRLNQLPNHRLRPGQQLRLGQEPKDLVPDAADPADTPSTEVTAATLPSAATAEGAACDLPADQEPAHSSASAPSPQRLARTIDKLRSLPYRFGGNGVRGIDCSGFVQKVFQEFAIDLPRSAREQYRLGVPVERNNLKQGDLVFFRTYAKYPSHVGIYLGDNKMVHASTRSRKVVISDITQSYYTKRYIGAKRLVDQEAENFRIDEVKDLLQEENAEDDNPVGFTGRRAAPAQRSVATPG